MKRCHRFAPSSILGWCMYVMVRHDVGGYHTCLSRRIPGFESPWRKLFVLGDCTICHDSNSPLSVLRHDVGGYHTCLSRRIPGFESPWRKSFEKGFFFLCCLRCFILDRWLAQRKHLLLSVLQYSIVPPCFCFVSWNPNNPPYRNYQEFICLFRPYKKLFLSSLISSKYLLYVLVQIHIRYLVFSIMVTSGHVLMYQFLHTWGKKWVISICFWVCKIKSWSCLTPPSRLKKLYT